MEGRRIESQSTERERMSEDWRERMERQMAFIVEQQAQYEIRSAKADERWAQADKRWKQADERWAKGDERWSRTEESIRALLAIAQKRQISEGRNGKT